MVIKLVTWFSLVIDHGSAVWQHFTSHFLGTSHAICLAFKVLYCCLCCAFVLCTHFSAHSFTAVICPAKHLPPLKLYSLSSFLHYKKNNNQQHYFFSFVSLLQCRLPALFQCDSQSEMDSCFLQFPAVLRPSIPVNKRPNLVGKPTDHGEGTDDGCTGHCCTLGIL